jgi:hypothetical protein
MIREDWTTNADYACLDVAPRGNSVNSHDHSSLFQLMLTSKGRALITNNGSGPYDGSPARMFRRSSAGHSTTTVDGKSSVPITGDMSFDAVIAPVIQDWISQPRYAYLGAVHEGYRRTANVPAVRRKVFYLRGGYWIILDRFSSGATGDEHAYEAHFHISAPVRLTPDGQAVTEGAGGNLVILQPDGARGEVKLEDCPFPLKGYANPRHLSFTQKRKGHGLMATVLVPFLDDRAPDVKVTALDVEQDDRWVTPYETTALEIVINGVRDVYVDQHMHWNLPWKAGGSIGDARLYHSRLTPRP